MKIEDRISKAFIK